MPINYGLQNTTVPRVAPVSPAEAVKLTASTHVKHVIKTGIQGYIDKFFNSTGRYRALMESVFPEGAKYITDRSYDFDEDATSHKLLLARFFEDLPAFLPCIMIADTSGAQYKNPGLGRTQGAIKVGPDKFANRFHIIREVTISILVATHSEETTNSIADMLTLMFGDLRGLLTGSLLYPDDATQHWEIRFPLNFEVGGTEHTAQGEDPKKQVWTTTISLPVTFEHLFLVEFDADAYAIHQAPPVPQSALQFPDVVRVGQRVRGFVSNAPYQSEVSTSDPNVASVSRGLRPCEYVLTIRRPGVFRVVLSGNKQDVAPGGGGFRFVPLLDKTITATY